MTLRLSQVVAVEVDVKGRTKPQITELHKLTQKADLFAGATRTYEPISDDGAALPPERKKVQLTTSQALNGFAAAWTEMLDATATKDWGNCAEKARADVVFDGLPIVKQAPVPFLLFLEKQLVDIRKAIEVLPVLDEAEDWEFDESLGYHRTRDAQKSHRTQKQPKVITLAPATVQHPAQTQLFTEDVIAGYWTAYKFSGAMPATKKAVMMDRVNELLKAVKVAREEANSAKVEKVEVGAALWKVILG